MGAGGGGLEEVGWLALSRRHLQKQGTEMGSMLQVLFRFQLQPFLINWLFSNPAIWGSGFDQWPHTQLSSHTRKHKREHTSILPVCCTEAMPATCVWSMCTRPESRICIISCSVVLIDRRIKWLVKESFMLLLSSFLTLSLMEFICQEKHLSSDVCVCDLGFDG